MVVKTFNPLIDCTIVILEEQRKDHTGMKDIVSWIPLFFGINALYNTECYSANTNHESSTNCR